MLLPHRNEATSTLRQSNEVSANVPESIQADPSGFTTATSGPGSSKTPSAYKSTCWVLSVGVVTWALSLLYAAGLEGHSCGHRKCAKNLASGGQWRAMRVGKRGIPGIPGNLELAIYR